MASEVSSDRVTGDNHGYIPAPVSEGMFPKPFGTVLLTKETAEKIFALEPGGVTGLVPGQRNGFYIFKLAGLQGAQNVKFEAVKDEVRKMATEYKVQVQAARLLQEMLSSAVIETGI